ncbi:MAG: PAS domain S-box protein [Desulfovibrionaceae bacterium]|nr:PAS domain S-box protein [Desulfovibrionaceae bacterium]
MPDHKTIFSNIPLPAILLSPEGAVLESNASAQSTFSDTKNGADTARAIRNWLADEVTDFLKSREAYALIERDWEAPGSGPRRFNVRLSRINGPETGPKAMAICSDITERFKAQEQIHHQLEIINSSNDAMLSMALDGKIFFANRSAAGLYGYTARELLDRSIYDLTPPHLKHEMRRVLREVRKRCHVVRLETLRRNRAGVNFPVSDSYSPIFSNGRPCAVSLVSRDISERKESELALGRSHAKLRNILDETVNALSMTLEKRDQYTAGHQQKVACISQAIGQDMGLDPNLLDSIHIAGVLHDIGKICIPMAILSKPSSLSPSEMEMVRNHPKNGLDIIKAIPFPHPVGDYIHQHHERLDGSGYPAGLKGDAISLGARIIAVADVLEAMGAHRPYRPALGLEAALDELKAHRGSKYDPAVCDSVRNIVDQGFITAQKGEVILCQSN